MAHISGNPIFWSVRDFGALLLVSTYTYPVLVFTGGIWGCPEFPFAFLKFNAERRPARATAEVVLRSGREVEKDVTSFDQDRIIEDFLRAYAKWMGW